MSETVYRTASPAETEALAARIAAEALPGSVFGLAGELGAGKTVFVRGFLRGRAGDVRDVHSPTFTLLNVYAGTPPISHFDLYRLVSGDDLDAIGFYEFTRGDGIALVEWADRFPEVAAEVDRWVRIGFGDDPDSRVIRITNRG